MMRRAFLLAGITGCFLAAPAYGQIISTEEDQQETVQPPSLTPPPQPGRVSGSSVGEVGQRQQREQADSVRPVLRVTSRIQNRVQSRLRTRIDRNYDPRANAASPFEAAEDQTRRAGQRQP